jgi:hypothetical protein
METGVLSDDKRCSSTGSQASRRSEQDSLMLICIMFISFVIIIPIRKDVGAYTSDLQGVKQKY